MTEAVTASTGGRAAPATIRPYRPLDHHACRQLWAELTDHHQEIYGEVRPADPGAGFEEYLTRLDLTGIWVADHAEDGVVGMVGLLLKGRAGEVDPVVVTQAHRGLGIGSSLLDHVAKQARRRGMARLTVTPSSRNESAVRCLFRAGYDEMASLTMAMDLDGQGAAGRTGRSCTGCGSGTDRRLAAVGTGGAGCG